PTVLAALGISDQAPAGALVGTPIVKDRASQDANQRLTAVLDIDQHSVAVRPITPRFYTLLIVSNLVLYVMVSLSLSGRGLGAVGRFAERWTPRRLRGRAPLTRRPERVLHALRGAGVVLGSLPVASFLANLSPWWRAPSP